MQLVVPIADFKIVIGHPTRTIISDVVADRQDYTLLMDVTRACGEDDIIIVRKARALARDYITIARNV